MSEHPPVSAADGEPVWTTLQVAEWLGISRQAVGKQVRAGRILGYRTGRSILFPAWQFDARRHIVRPEIAELLEAVGGWADHRSIANWLSTGSVAGSEAVPRELLLGADTKDELIRAAQSRAELRKSASGEDHTPPQNRAELRESASGEDHTPPQNRAELRESASGEDHTPPQGRFMQLVREQLVQLVSDQRNEGARDAQSAILWAAAELFAVHGPAQVSLRAVAAEAGVSYGLIYRFYRSKENLLSRVVELLVEAGNRHVAAQPDIYTAIDATFGADEGRWGRMVSWAVLDGVSPADFFRNVRGGGYRRQVEELWADPVPPNIRARFDPHVIAELLSLVNEFWTINEPYLGVVVGPDSPPPEERRAQVIEALQLLVWASRPRDEEPEKQQE